MEVLHWVTVKLKIHLRICLSCVSPFTLRVGRDDKKVLKSTRTKATKEVVCASKDFVCTAIKSLGDLILALNMTKKSRHRHRHRQYHHHYHQLWTPLSHQPRPQDILEQSGLSCCTWGGNIDVSRHVWEERCMNHRSFSFPFLALEKVLMIFCELCLPAYDIFVLWATEREHL